MASRVMLVAFVVVSLSFCTAAPVDKITYLTSSNGVTCRGAAGVNTNCDGGFERDFTTTASETNVIPQVANIKLKYSGLLAASRHISLVDSSLNNGLPCVAGGGSPGAFAAASADARHSGKLTANADKIVTLPQTILLDATKTFVVCYSTTVNGATSDAWASSNILIRVSKIEKITVYGRNFKTQGTIPNHGSLTLTYSGTVLNQRWISFVDSTLNNGQPCRQGATAAAPLDSQHSGSLKASTLTTFTANTAALSGTALFAVCYAESGGITSSQWRDSGIRIYRSKVTQVRYGVDSKRFGTDFSRATYNRNTNDVNNIATDTFPQVANAQLQYVGELGANKKIALVDASESFNNPCGYPQQASKASSTGLTNQRTHSGVVTAGVCTSVSGNAGNNCDANLDGTFAETCVVGARCQQAGANNGGCGSSGVCGGSKTVVIPQGTNNLLHATKTFAVCYAEGTGDSSDETWADSYARFKISKIEALAHHSVLHVTTGVLPNTGAVAAEKLKLGWVGSLATGNNAKIALEASTDLQHATGPCPSFNPATAASATTSGALTPVNTKNYVELKTQSLNTGTIDGAGALTKYHFAVCYSENGGGYVDSGIRVTVGKVQTVSHGNSAAGSPHGERVMKPVEAGAEAAMPTAWKNSLPYPGIFPMPGLSNSRNVIPQAPNQKLTYVSGSIQGTALGQNRFISLVDASRNGNKPCAYGPEAAAQADTLHSGSIHATGSYVTIPQQAHLLDHTKVFAVCYAITSGTIADTTWTDSYVRVTISKVQSISSLGVQHKVSSYDGQIASRAATVQITDAVTGIQSTVAEQLDLTYAGTLATGKYISLVQDDTNSGFPCATTFHSGQVTASAGPDGTAGQTRTGKRTATGKTILATTKTLANGQTFAFCYSEDSTNWYDSGIRVTRSKIYSMRYDSYAVTNTHQRREQTSVFRTTNRIPQVVDMKIQYYDDNQANGELGDDKYVSLVDAAANNGDPCVNKTSAEAAASTTSSGAIKARNLAGTGSGKYIKVPQAPLLSTAKTFAVCYTEADVGAGASNAYSWKDSYIRLKVSQVLSVSQNLGKWTGTCHGNAATGCSANAMVGVQHVHLTVGQLPQMQASDVGLELSLAGTLPANGNISLVDREANPSDVHGIRYYDPCTVTQAATVDSTHSGWFQATSSKISSLDTTSLDTTKTYAVCYGAPGSVAADSGIRLTVSKIKYLWTSSRHAGISNRIQSSVYRPTNRLPKKTNMKLTYEGDLAAQKSISLVAATATGSPCDDSSTAAGGHSAARTGVILGDANKVITVPQTTLLTASQVFAVCYTEGAQNPATNRWWLDSGIRLAVSEIESVKTVGIKHVTTGQIPNTIEGLSFEYDGSLGNQKKIALVAAQLNSNLPCHKSQASATADADHSGPAAPKNNDKKVNQLDTQGLNVDNLYAICYTSAAGDAADTLWEDSGIRVTLPKVWNMLAKSGFNGPSCTLNTTLNGNPRHLEAHEQTGANGCKYDTKARDMTSKPLSTNRIAQARNQALSYWGTLATGKFISLIADDLNPSSPSDGSAAAGSNPCVDPAVAGALADSTHSGVAQALPSAREVIIPQSTYLDASKTYAVCYAELSGTSTDATWRDSYIRLKISEIEALNVLIPTMTYGTKNSQVTTSTISLRTVGQVPNQGPGLQVLYEYIGTLAANKHINLIDATLNTVTDTNTGWGERDGTDKIGKPCELAAEAGKAKTGGTHAGAVTARHQKTVSTLDTTALTSTKTFALCYSSGSWSTAATSRSWKDSGIRITVPKLTSVDYKGTNGDVITKRVRTMTSLHLATHKLPRTAGNIDLHYAGGLANNKYVSIVDASLNNNNPCVDPTVAAASATGWATGVRTAAAAKVTFADTSQLDATKTFAVCYAELAGNQADKSWRDSFIRLSISKILQIKSYKVPHTTTGQIPNNPKLKMAYSGTLAVEKHISLVLDTRGSTVLGNASYAFPCSSSAEAAKAPDPEHSGLSTAGTGGRTVEVNTVDLKPIDAGAEAEYAVCYSDTTSSNTEAFHDSGIRLTVPEVINMQQDSGYTKNTKMKVCVKIGNTPGSNCDVNLDGTKNQVCTRFAPCTNDAGCGTGGKCAYQEFCTSVGGTGISNNLCDHNFDGVFDGQCSQNSPCQSSNADNGGCGSNGVCGFYGTPVRNQKSWACTGADTCIDTPTNRLPKLANTKLTMVFHKTNTMQDNDFISIVDASENNHNPCVLGTNAGKAADSTHSGKLTASSREVQVANAHQLLVDKTYAVCYAKTDGNTNDETWRDTYIRLKPTDIASLTTIGVVHVTTGMIPNVVASDKMKFTYTGTLDASSQLSFMREDMFGGLPCEHSNVGAAQPSAGPALRSWAHRTNQSGAQTATAGQRFVDGFDTTYMTTETPFALCYKSSQVGSVWRDSGIRVTVPKIHNVQFASGHTGPAATGSANTIDGVCRASVACTDKTDTKPREQTSNPLSTNRLPQKASQDLTYRGTLGSAKWVSLVAVGTLYGTSAEQQLNPCTLPWYAGAPATTQTSGVMQASGNKVTVPQTSTGTLLDKTKTFAVCYSEFTGSRTDHTWRDSYIRLKISQIESMRVQIPLPVLSTKNSSTVTTTIGIKTVGQVVHSRASEQVTYKMVGSVASNSYVCLVQADTRPQTDSVVPTATTGYTGIVNDEPCKNAGGYNPKTAAGGSGSKQLSAGELVNLDSTSLLTNKVYALCFSSDDTNWEDAGIRLTVPKLHTLKYIDGHNSAITARTRPMTSIFRATHRLPQIVNAQLTYDGDLGATKFVSLVNANLNGGNPCVNPAVAAASADGQHSGAVQASGSKVVTFPQSTLLLANTYYAACYSDGNGTATDYQWRDSYIRLEMSKVATISSHSVTHTTTGQIPNHRNLKITFNGQLAQGRLLALVDANRQSVTLGSKTYPMPCSNATEAYKGSRADEFHSAAKSVSGSTVTIDTNDLNSSPLVTACCSGHQTPQPTDPRYFAVCYSEEQGANAASVWKDSGIRVTVPEFINFQVASGYGTDRPRAAATLAGDGSPWRDQTSEPLAINRLPQKTGQELTYIVHSRSNGCRNTANTAADPACANANGKYISLVDASLNNGDPCVQKTIAENGAGSQHTGTITAAANTKKVTVDASSLDPTKTFAVCYSKGNRLWGSSGSSAWASADSSIGGTNAVSFWRDSYVRLKISKIETLVTAGVTHRTYGQVPNVVPSDSLQFQFTGSLANDAYLSLVMASASNNDPCADGANAAHVKDSEHTGPKKATAGAVSDFDTSILRTDPAASLMYVGDTTSSGGWFALCYTETVGDATQTWTDSGIRVTVPKVYSAQYSSLHPGTPPRELTSHFLPTNRIPTSFGASKPKLALRGFIATNKWASLIDASLNNNNPCVNGQTAATATGGTASGPVQTTQVSLIGLGGTPGELHPTAEFDTSNMLVRAAGTHAVKTYALCYDEIAGNAASTTWKDSYIRIQLSEIWNFGTKNVYHHTAGQLPHHKAGLVYDWTGTLLSGKHIALVDESVNQVPVSGFAVSIPAPCLPGEATHIKDSRHSFKHTTFNGKSLKTLDTTGLNTNATFALCVGGGDGSSGAAGGWHDSGIRLTVSMLDTIEFSGYLAKNAAARGKKYRSITSELAPLQSVGSEHATVLPYHGLGDGLAFVYKGDLGFSHYVSLVDVAANTNNPCANPLIAAAGASTHSSGPIRACFSAENHCSDYGRDGATTNRTKEVVIPGAAMAALDKTKTFTICYASGDGALATNTAASLRSDPYTYPSTPYTGVGTNKRTISGAVTWRDSYIRIKLSAVSSIVATGVTHTDKGHIADHEAAAMLPVTYSGSLNGGKWLSLVDETLDSGAGAFATPAELRTLNSKNEPCVKAAVAAAAPSSQHSGPFKAGTVCTVMGSSNVASNCDESRDGVFNEQCRLGSSCNSNNANNGGCGTGGKCGITSDLNSAATSTASSTTVWMKTSHLDTSKTFAVCYSDSTQTTAAGVRGGAITWHDSGIRVTISKLKTIRDNRAQLPLYTVGAKSTSQFARDLTSSRAKVGRTRCLFLGTNKQSTCDVNGDGVFNEMCAAGAFCDPDLPKNGGCGDTKGICNSGLGWRQQTVVSNIAQWSRTVYNYPGVGDSMPMHKLRQLGHGVGLELEYFGDLANGKHVSIVSSSENQGDPCALGSIAAASKITAVANVFTVLNPTWDVSKSYTVCYAEGSGTASDTSWRDSYIRFTISQVSSISTHQINHRTQGHIPNGQFVGITYAGIENGWSLSLMQDEYPYKMNPCTDPNVAQSSSTNLGYTGFKTAASNSQTITFDTRYLNEDKNFAVCYKTTSAGATWRDSGIRTTVSRITQLQYNKRSLTGSQQGSLDYTRLMTSINTFPATDAMPVATNRIAHSPNLELEYNGNLVVKSSGTVEDQSIANDQYIAIVKTNFNNDNNPCVTRCPTSAACASNSNNGAIGLASTERTGVMKARTGTKSFTVPQAAGKELGVNDTYAVCYGQLKQESGGANNQLDDSTMRDSYIRLKPSKIHSIQSYGIDHYTFGDVAGKAVLPVTTKPAAPIVKGHTRLAFVDESLNDYNPCVGAHAGRTPVDTVADATQGHKTQYSGVSSGSGNQHGLKTSDLSADKTFAVCYTESLGNFLNSAWTDTGIRVMTPQVQSITYGNPERVITADSCFSGNVAGIASCKVGASDAHYQIGATLPRAANVSISYQGPIAGAGLASGKWISLVEQTQTAGGSQANNPCREGHAAAAAANSAGSSGTGGQDSEGGARLHTGPVQASTGSSVVIIPQTYSGSALVAPQNFLDLTKTYAVCYSKNAGAVTDGDCTSSTHTGCTNNGQGRGYLKYSTAQLGWRDSYIRVTLSRMKTLSMVHSGHHLVDVTTVGTFSNVPSLEVQWDGSLLHNQWLRFTAETENTNAPCDKSNFGAAASQTSVAKISSLPGSRRATFDTSNLANTAKVESYFAVCYATGDGTGSDTSWRDSAIRIRFIRWTNPEKHRVVSGAPVRLTFGINAGLFDSGKDKVVLLLNKTNCDTAPSAPALSNGMQVARTVDFFCSKVSVGYASTCDSNFDGVFNEQCRLGSLCKPAVGTNGGCGNTGVCSAGVQLPTGKSYNEVQDTTVLKETALVEGTYAMCVCLGKTGATTISGSRTILNLADISNTSYGPPNGDGGCNAANEYTLLSGAGNSLKVISEPKLGRFLEQGDVQGTLRSVAGKSTKYQIRTTQRTAGFQVANADKIYFFPKSVGCAHKTRYSGAGSHVYDHATHSYISTGVDRRWRTESLMVCNTIGSSNVQANCDSNNDGVFAETCAVGTICKVDNPHQGGCGSGGGSCGKVLDLVAIASSSRTPQISIADYDAATHAATFSTPAGAHALSSIGDYVACFATKESLQGIPMDSTDFVPLTHGLEVIAAPRLGPQNAPGNIHALENSSPSFNVNSFKDQDLYFFMPQDQYTDSAAHTAASTVAQKRYHVKDDPASDACTRHVCTSVAGSSIGSSICDSDWDGEYDDACVQGAKCNISNPNHGGCGTNGKCEQRVPTTGTSMYTNLIAGSDFVTSNGVAIGKLSLPSTTKLAVPAFFPYPSAWYLAVCLIPAGATKSVSNVFQLPDKLTIFKEPTDALLTSWFQYQVAELRFTQPQQGLYGNASFATGQSGDIVVLQKSNCDNVHSITPASYFINSATKSRKMVLTEAGGETLEDEKGGTAGDNQLAQGAVNELSPGTYKICYATKSSEGESASDFKMLAKSIEILPPPATKPTISLQRSIILGQDMVASWASNIGLQTRRSASNSWLGLYKKGDCVTGEGQHQCHIAYQFIHQNVNTGTVIFSQKDYKVSGEYEIRYFSGDSRNGQGEVCGGLPNVDHETYVRCTLSASATSETITVLSNDIADTEDLASKPGMEAVFGNGNRGRYHRTKQY